jgi:Tfp pilus assembly protein PilV
MSSFEWSDGSHLCENRGVFSRFDLTLAGLRKWVCLVLLIIITIKTMRAPAAPESALTLPEVLVAILLLAIFCSSVFELNAISLRYIDAGKESIAALEGVHDRCEALRNLAFTDLTTSSYVQSLLAAPANGSDFWKKATEVVTLRAFPTANGMTRFTRTPDGTVTANSLANDLGTTLVQVDVSTSWNMTLSGRSRSEQTTIIISNGTKK